MDSVFILWHGHQSAGDSDDKLMGVYKTREDAEAAIGRLKDKPVLCLRSIANCERVGRQRRTRCCHS